MSKEDEITEKISEVNIGTSKLQDSSQTDSSKDENKTVSLKTENVDESKPMGDPEPYMKHPLQNR